MYLFCGTLFSDMIADYDYSKLMTHLYEFFGSLLGCSTIGMKGYPAYSGSASMYEVHK